MGKIIESVLAIIGIIFTFCLISRSSAEELKDGKYNLEAFSVSLPATSGWQKESQPNQLHVGRSLGGTKYTFVLSAREYPLTPEPVSSISDLLVYVSSAAEKEAQAEERYQLKTHSENITSRLGLECVEYQKSWIDHGARIVEYEELIMLANGLICIHPESAFRLIEISYSSRNSSGIVPQEIKNEGETFINSLKAQNLKQK